MLSPYLDMRSNHLTGNSCLEQGEGRGLDEKSCVNWHGRIYIKTCSIFNLLYVNSSLNNEKWDQMTYGPFQFQRSYPKESLSILNPQHTPPWISLTLSINHGPIQVNKLLFSKHYLLGKLSLIYPLVWITLNRNSAVDSHVLKTVSVLCCLFVYWSIINLQYYMSSLWFCLLKHNWLTILY